MNFVGKLVTLRPGDAVYKMIKDVMNGRAEGEDFPENEDEASGLRTAPKGIFGRVSFLLHLLLL